MILSLASVFIILASFFSPSATIETFPACQSTLIALQGEDQHFEKAYAFVETEEGYFRAGRNGDLATLQFLDFELNTIWQRNFQFASGQHFIYGLSIDSEGFLVGVGRNGGTDATENFIFRYDHQNDEVLWHKVLLGNNLTRMNNILELPNGNFSVWGVLGSSLPPGNTFDFLLMEVDRETGDLVEEHTKNTNWIDSYSNAQIYNDHIYASGFITLGSTAGDIRPSLTKFDLELNEIWTKSYLEGAGTVARLYGEDVSVRNDTVWLFGRGSLNSQDLGNSTAQVIGTDLDGNILFAKDLGLVGSTSLNVRTVLEVADGFIIQGNHQYDGDGNVFLIKIGFDAEPVWGKTIGIQGNQGAISCELIKDRIIISGDHTDATSGDTDLFMAVLNLDGEVEDGENCDWITSLGFQETIFNVLVELTPASNEYNPTFVFFTSAVNGIAQVSPPYEIQCGQPCMPTSVQEVILDQPKLFVPNAFSPDGDGENEQFLLFSSEPEVMIEQVVIFNRAGQVMYEHALIPAGHWEGWNGKFQDQHLPSGVYVYHFSLLLPDGKKEKIQGDVLLIR